MPDLPDKSSIPGQQDPLLSDRLQQLIRSLPTVARTVLVLRHQEDMSPEEISGMLAKPLATVKSHLQRTQRLLREKCTRALR